MTFPSAFALISKWAPPAERSKMTSMMQAGIMCGTVVSMSVTGSLCASLGWESVFYVFGAIGVGWFVFWAAFVTSSPDQHRCISEYEKRYIEEAIGDGVEKTAIPTPWKEFLTSVPFWAITFTHVTQVTAKVTSL